MSAQADAERFEELYRATRKDILAYLVRRAGDREQAADLLAETYLIAWRKLPEVPDGDQARLWLFGVARNLQLKHAGRQRSHAALVQRLADELHHTAPAAVPEDDRADALRKGLTSLPEREREILLLTAWEGFAPREIAAITGSTANIVRVRLTRARSKLRARLDDPALPAPPPAQPVITHADPKY
jgi:RNA polymerase sigma-70 factor, ECF subfamily